MEKKRSSFTGKIGFVLAAAGSAVGLGNIWRFPYLAAKHGGGMFLLVYVILALTFGFTLMIGEIALGRKTGLSAVGAFKVLNKKYAFIGTLASVVPVLIMPYYSVIGGWVSKYFSAYITGAGHAAAAESYFGDFISRTWEPIGWFFLFIAATALIVLCGVEKGIEKVSKFMMPVLVLLTLFLAIYGLFLPGAMDGFLYYIKPDFSKFSVTTVLAAMGQMFYSMSLATGIMITYGSYMKKDVDLESSVHQIEWFDTGVAFLAGMMIVPASFAFYGGNESALSKGPSLMFVTLPKVFDGMPGGVLVGAVFFLLVLVAALTSSISLMETIVCMLHDRFHMERKKSCILVFVYCLLMGIPSSLGFGVLSDINVHGLSILDMFDFLSNSVLMPIVAFLTCVFISFVIKPKAIEDEVEQEGVVFKRKKLFRVIIKYVAPVCIILILITSVLEGFGIYKI